MSPLGTLITVLLAVTPPVLFLVWILRYDRNEPEPLGMVLRILLLGSVSVFPVALLEAAYLSHPVFSIPSLAGSALQSFLVISPAEETAKLLIVLLFVWRSRHFTEPNDGIVYAGTASIGFALSENLFYVLQHGAGVGIARALTSIPGHTFRGVIMGWYLGQARFDGSGEKRAIGIVKGFLAAWFLHGLYDTFVLSGTSAALLVIPLVVLNFIVGIKLLRKGRALSEGRSVTGSPARVMPARGGCLKVLGRALLTLSALFWLLIVLGLLFGGTEDYDTASVLYGSVVITFLPVAAGVIIEASLRGRRRIS